MLDLSQVLSILRPHVKLPPENALNPMETIGEWLLKQVFTCCMPDNSSVQVFSIWYMYIGAPRMFVLKIIKNP